MPEGDLSDAADKQAFPRNGVCILYFPDRGCTIFATFPGFRRSAPCWSEAGCDLGAGLLRDAACAPQLGKPGCECQMMSTLAQHSGPNIQEIQSSSSLLIRRFSLPTAY